MNIVFIVPTGIGCEIGGHAGDANPVVKLFAGLSDTLITHPNAVNASDINEMTENTLYVEGSMLDRFLEGDFNLKKVYYNKILCVTNSPLDGAVINSVSAARATIGADIEIAVLDTPLQMIGKIENGKASGDVLGWEELCHQVRKYDFDALAITTPIDVERDTKMYYFKNGGINPWGGVEAKASKLIANDLNLPVAHSPVENVSIDDKDLFFIYKQIVDPRMSAEVVSVSYLHCILKGLHKAPRPTSTDTGISVDDIDFLITPINCVGRPHYACMEKGIKIIAVKENQNVLNDKMPDEFIVAENYLDAAGIVAAYKSGIDYRTVRRPLNYTKINK